jgi:hypothetical protein
LADTPFCGYFGPSYVSELGFSSGVGFVWKKHVNVRIVGPIKGLPTQRYLEAVCDFQKIGEVSLFSCYGFVSETNRNLENTMVLVKHAMASGRPFVIMGDHNMPVDFCKKMAIMLHQFGRSG